MIASQCSGLTGITDSPGCRTDSQPVNSGRLLTSARDTARVTARATPGPLPACQWLPPGRPPGQPSTAVRGQGAQLPVPVPRTEPPSTQSSVLLPTLHRPISLPTEYLNSVSKGTGSFSGESTRRTTTRSWMDITDMLYRKHQRHYAPIAQCLIIPRNSAWKINCRQS